MSLVQLTEKGLYCAQGQFFIDPWRPVENAVVTHAHADHAYPNMQNYLAHPLSAAVMRHRLGKVSVQEMDYGQSIFLNGVRVSFHPAGHVPGSAQVRVESKGKVMVVTGDFKVENDGLSTPFEPISCHQLISECTFGLPIFRWKNQAAIQQEMVDWVNKNRSEGRISVFLAYSLGKAQRLLHLLRPFVQEIFCHSQVFETNEVLRQAGLPLPEYLPLKFQIVNQIPEGAVVITSAGSHTLWENKAGKQFSVAQCSGWMEIRGFKRRNGTDKGFVISDHADWPGLHAALKDCAAEKVWFTHGYAAAMARYLGENGKEAFELKTQFGQEETT